MRSMPDFPSISPCHVASLPMPRGEIMPMPVMTTRRLVKRVGVFWLLRFGVFVDVLDGVLDLADLLRLIVGNLDAELFLESHDQLDGIERVRAEVLNERSLRGDLLRVDAELLDDD